MAGPVSSINLNRQANQALVLWGVFLVLIVILNGTIPFLFGADLRLWTYSSLKDILFNLIIYSGIFLVIPLIIEKSWTTIRQPGFLIPLLTAVIAITLRTYFRPIAVISVVSLAYLHWRYDLSNLGLQSNGWKKDLLAILILGVLPLIPASLTTDPELFTPQAAFIAALDRLFANPASTTENMFYFGFLAERLCHKTGKLWTPLLIGAMYTLHEMTNPEYWYEDVSFMLIPFGVAIIASIYLWRRSIIVVWIGDGLARFMSRLFLIVGG